MASLNNMIFGPLDQEYCSLFYIISMFSFVLMMLLIIVSAYMLLFSAKRKTLDSKYWMMTFSTFTVYFFVYLQNRLQYNMCLDTKK